MQAFLFKHSVYYLLIKKSLSIYTIDIKKVQNKFLKIIKLNKYCKP